MRENDDMVTCNKQSVNSVEDSEEDWFSELGYEIWLPFDAPEAAAMLTRMLEEDERSDLHQKTSSCPS